MRNQSSARLHLIFVGLLLFISSILWFDPAPVLAQSAPPDGKVPVYYFWGDGCPVCAKQEPFMEMLAARFPQVELLSYEVWNNDSNRQLFFAMAANAGFEPRGVPTTFIGDQVWVGFTDSMKPEMEAVITACIESGCPDPATELSIPPSESSVENPKEEPVEEPQTAAPTLLELPLIGSIDLNAQSLTVSTAIIAFVDGFNPCSLWVLSILLALAIYTGSRFKTLIVGLTFLIVTASLYGLFMVGLFSVFSYVSYLKWVQILVAAIALLFGLVNIKDYFWYKEGVSFTISDKHKPTIYSRMRNVITSGKSIWAMIGATVFMAGGISLVEMPCTAGFPVLWSNLIAAHNVSRLEFARLLGLYLLIYLIDELIVFFTVVITLKASRLEEKHGRVLKLIGGTVMVTLAFVMAIDPELMNNIGTSLLIFGAAFGFAFLVLLLHRRILPKFGVTFGSEFAKGSDRRNKHRRLNRRIK